MLILTRAPQDAVVNALGSAHVDADVGPTSASGLTAVWCTGEEPVRALAGSADLVAVWDEPAEGHTVLHLSVEEREREQVWTQRTSDGGPTDGVPTAGVPSAGAGLADDLGRFFGTTPSPALATELARTLTAEHLTDLLEQHFTLPTLDPVRRRAVTAHRGRSADARIAGRLTARGGSAVRVTPVGDSWTVLGTDHVAVQQVVSLAVAAAAARRDVVLHLWRGDGAAAGFELVHREHVIAHGAWDDGWRHLGDEDWQHRDAAAEVLARRVGGAVDVPALRALLRSRTRSTDPLARLVELLGVPPAVLDVLDGTASAPDAEHAEPAGWWRALREETWRDDARSPGGPRWLQLVVAALVGLGSLGVLVYGLAVIATDGALLDHAGATRGDWLLLSAAIGGVCLSSWAAHRLVRRGQLL